jgi:hypothetical protein
MVIRTFEFSLSDSEVITMEIVAEFQGIDTDKVTWQYFRRHSSTINSPKEKFIILYSIYLKFPQTFL